MTRFHVLLAATGLLLVAIEPSSAAKRMAHTNSAVRSQSHAQAGVSASGPHSRDPYPYSREPDPYAPGVNWPKGA